MTASGAGPVSLRVEDVGKRFEGGTGLSGVSLDFVAGGFNTLLGPSGCGKTTLLRIVAGFLSADSGRVFIGGEDRTATPAWLRRIGFVFQSYALWPHMSVAENVGYGLRLRRLDGPAVERRTREALERVGLPGAGPRHPGQLSGGQQQRVALARALVLEPAVLLLDEPLSNLDARLRVEMRRELRRLQRDLGTTTVYVTHDQEEAFELSDLVAVLSQGRLEQVGAAQDVYRRPSSPAVAAFLGNVALLAGEAQADGSLQVQGARLPLALPASVAGRALRVGLRPEDLEIVPASDDAIGGRVVDSAYLGHAFRLAVRVADGLELVAHSLHAVAVGTAVGLRRRGGEPMLWLEPSAGGAAAGAAPSLSSGADASALEPR